MAAILGSQLNEYLAFSERLADEAAAVIMPYFRQTLAVTNKGDGALFDPVTAADMAAETAMRKLIEANYPDHGILGEEAGELLGSSHLKWVLDPIDGTRAFITGLPLWGTLVALNDGTAPLIGLMNQPFTGECFIGSPLGSFCNGKPILTRKCTELSSATLMCTTPDMFTTLNQKAGFERVAKRVRLLRYGGDCYAYCMLASGFVDVIVEAALQPYDVQALIPIIEGAGGVISDWSGGTAQNGGQVVACGDPALHKQVMEMLNAR